VWSDRNQGQQDMWSVRQQLRTAGLGVSYTGPKDCRTCG